MAGVIQVHTTLHSFTKKDNQITEETQRRTCQVCCIMVTETGYRQWRVLSLLDSLFRALQHRAHHSYLAYLCAREVSAELSNDCLF